MSTNNPTACTPSLKPIVSTAQPELPAQPSSAPAVPTDGLDVSVIARLANELFHALPLDSAAPTAGSVPVTAPSFKPEMELPSNPHFPTLPASAGPTHVAPATAVYQAGPPAVPGSLASVAGEAPPFATPSLEAVPPAVPVVQTVAPLPAPATVPGAQFSFLEERRGLSPTTSDTPPSLYDGNGFDFGLELANEYITVPDASAFGGYESFSFLESARPLGSYESFTQAAPLGFEDNVPTHLGLTDYPFDAEAIKHDFPILKERVNGRPLVWLDNAATTQKPKSVIDRLSYFYEHENSNVHRAAHELAARATDAYEGARDKVKRFLKASSTDEIVFVRGATEGINLIAKSWGRRHIEKDDEIVITWLEHHANIVPWQMLCAETGAKLRVAPVDDTGQVILDEYEKLLGPRTRLVSFTQVSNALGVVTPAAQMIEMAHRHGAKVLLDGAQSVLHMPVDVQALGCDFFVFSGHKVYGPTGIGAVYGTPAALKEMPPWQGGGNMIVDVTFEKTIYHNPPARFEAGTGNIADAVGLGAAIDYLDRLGMPNVARHEHNLLQYATEELLRIPGLRLIGTAKEKAGVLSFVLDGYKTEEVGSHLNRYGIAVRSGHHCAQPILRRFGLESSVRASLALYNTYSDIDQLTDALKDLKALRTTIA